MGAPYIYDISRLRVKKASQDTLSTSEYVLSAHYKNELLQYRQIIPVDRDNRKYRHTVRG